jgi:hypothetical protein
MHPRIVLCIIVSLAVLGMLGCGKSPTTAEPPPDPPPAQPAISISISPSSGKTDAEVTVTLSIKANNKEIKVFGFDLTFETKMFTLLSVGKGDLTSSWAAVDGNEIESGKVRIGGFTGSGSPLPVNSDGSFVKIKFKVTGGNSNDGTQSQLCAKDYSDDISGLIPEPACAQFTYRK